MIVQEMVVTFLSAWSSSSGIFTYKAVRRPFGHVMNSWLEFASSCVCDERDGSWAGTADVEENLIRLPVSSQQSWVGRLAHLAEASGRPLVPSRRLPSLRVIYEACMVVGSRRKRVGHYHQRQSPPSPG